MNYHYLFSGENLYQFTVLLKNYNLFQIMPYNNGLLKIDASRPENNIFHLSNFIFYQKMKIELAKEETIHFIGIGGIGMSGLSLIMKGKGFKIKGSDIIINKNIERLKKEKIKIFIGQKKQNLKDATIVVISSAIKNNNPELVEAKKRKFQ